MSEADADAAVPAALPAGPAEPAAAAPPAKLTLKERLKAHFAEYGRISIITYLVLSLLAIVAFSIAIGVGVEPSSASGFFGVILAGWLAAKATLPLRILATLALTPAIAALVRRRGRAPRTDD